MSIIFNPLLPLNVYIPDVEPHIFGDRLYLFGSHDQEGGTTFCMLDYEVFSAPVSDLTQWRSEGIIYRSSQDPLYSEKYRYMYAPDVVQGRDGRYYLYYALAGDRGRNGFDGPIRIAVCASPAGKYQYYGYVRSSDGMPFTRKIPFDPAVICDESTTHLYYGWSLPVDRPKSLLKKWIVQHIMCAMFHKTPAQINAEPEGIMGAYSVCLGSDMCTVEKGPSLVVPGQPDAKGTSFEGHAFFEASSIRKIGDIYYFIYSSQKNHELCYATSKFPDRDFVFGGTIISQGDVGLAQRAEADRLNMTGNNHGSLVQVNGQWYVFYHRHTHGNSYNRQACAEPVTISPDGFIPQVPVTSSGLYGAPLPASGLYPAVCACILTNGHMPHAANRLRKKVSFPHITHQGNDRFIAEIRNRTYIGYRNFIFYEKTRLTLRMRGNMRGTLFLFYQLDAKPICTLPLTPSEDWADYSVDLGLSLFPLETPLYLLYTGRGSLSLLSLYFSK